MLEKKLKNIETFTADPDKNSRFCIDCGKLATKRVYYQTEGAIIVEKYCDECVSKVGSINN